MHLTAVLEGAHDTVNGVTVRVTWPGSYTVTTPATLQTSHGGLKFTVVSVPKGLRLVSPATDGVTVRRGQSATYLIRLAVDEGSTGVVPGRDPGARTPLDSIPSGPVDRP